MQIKKRTRRIFLFAALPLLAAAALLLFRTGASPKARTKSAEAAPTFVLLLEQIDEAYEPCLHVGDRIVDRQSRRILGSVTAIEAHRATAEVFSETQGRMIESAVPGRLNLFLTVSPSEEEQRSTAAAGKPPRIGQIYYFRTYDYIGEGRVVRLL